MILLDGCFIIELFRKSEIYKKTRQEEYDPIFQTEWMVSTIARDLLLFENQLPLFILSKLFGMNESNGSRNLEEHFVHIEEKDGISVGSSTSTVQIIPTQLNDLVLGFFSSFLPFQWNVETSTYNSTEKIEHLLHLTDEALTHSLLKIVYKNLEFGFRFKNAAFEHLLGGIHATICISILDIGIDHAKECQEAGVKLKKAEIFKHLFGLICKAAIPLLAKMKSTRKAISYFSECQRLKTGSRSQYLKELREAGVKFHKAKKFKRLHALREIDDRSIHSATELEEVGVKFKKDEKSNLVSIKFNNGLMEISPLSIEDRTETYLWNLIAYEHYCDPQNGSNYVYNYVCFMDRLIKSPKDVELLCQKGIISNCLGDDEIISAMVNKLAHHVAFSTSIYARTFMNLNMHCR
ncbi:hypothetical protein F2P56_015164 [Juglans regia]|uniref:Uncharacterized protein n=2 Tax=Juglans regia TaxID=51240 RepID=A0A833XEN9_JUGRE|nr:uncharacterized protein LOC108990821 [Juglans regia]KAF5465133.1 hypothetical protein F2P56_015164 [Juglans regia]